MQTEEKYEDQKKQEFYSPEKEKEGTREAKKEVFPEKEPLAEEEKIHKEKKFVPSVEKITSSLSSGVVPSPREIELLEEDKKIVSSLVAIVIKNPDLEKGLEEANKILNEEAKKRKIREDSELVYLIDAFHDELIKKLREREQRFSVDK